MNKKAFVKINFQNNKIRIVQGSLLAVLISISFVHEYPKISINSESNSAPVIKNSEKVDWNAVTNYFHNPEYKKSLSKLIGLPYSENGISQYQIEKAANISDSFSNNFVSKMSAKNANFGDFTKQKNNVKNLSLINYKPSYNNFHDFSTNQNFTKSVYLQTYNHSFYSNSLFSTSLTKDQVEKNYKTFIHKLNVAYISLTTLSVVCGVASVGFWAAAWFFGISVPWAIASDTACAALGVASAALGVYTATLDAPSTIFDKISWATSIRGLASVYKDIIYPITVGIDTVVAADSWAIPALLAIIGLGAGIISWVAFLQTP